MILLFQTLELTVTAAVGAVAHQVSVGCSSGMLSSAVFSCADVCIAPDFSSNFFQLAKSSFSCQSMAARWLVISFGLHDLEASMLGHMT